MSKSVRVLRIATVYHGSVVRDATCRSGRVTLGTGESNMVVAPTVGIPEGFELLNGSGGSFTLRVTDAIGGQFRVGGTTYDLQGLIASEHASKSGSVSVEDADGNKSNADQYEVNVTAGDWGVIRIQEVEVVFQWVIPPGAIAGAASFGGVSGAIAGLVAAAFSVLGVGFLFAGVGLGGLLGYAMWTDNTKLDEQEVIIDERWQEIMTEVDETEEEEIIEEEEPDIDEAGKRAAGEEGKFGEDDPEDPETVLPDLDAKMVEELDKPVGIQAAVGSNLLGPGGAQSLFGSGETFGDAMDQVAMSGEGDAFNAGFGYGGMGSMGRGGGGGGTGPGRIGGLANKDTGGGRGSGKGLGKKKKAKVKPKVKFEAPKQEGFCKKENIASTVKRKGNSLRNCYERQLLADPELSGKVVVQWKVQLDGTVKDPYVKSSTMKNDKVERCLTRVVNRLRFDKPDGGICIIEYPFSFSPSS